MLTVPFHILEDSGNKGMEGEIGEYRRKQGIRKESLLSSNLSIWLSYFNAGLSLKHIETSSFCKEQP